jgi:phage tail sheath protein FI
MPANFLHGVETITIDQGPRPVTIVKSAVVGLVGIAPLGSINTPILVTGDASAAQFGKSVPGFNIPQALDAIFKQGAGAVVVVNVFDPAAHTTQVTAEAQTVTLGKIKLGFAPIGTVSVLDSTGTASTLVLNTDYTLDEYGNFNVISGNAAAVNSTVLKFTYKKLNAAAITASVLNGSVDGTTGARTGMKCWPLSKNVFGFNPKILIAPGYSGLTAVATELLVQANALRAITLLDAPYGTTVAGAIAGRGVSGNINFNVSDKRADLLYPYLKAYDAATDSNLDFPQSAFKAGIYAATDLEFGFWFSPSNKEIKGIVGAERNISASLNDANSDANLLNAAGISTIFNTFGTGIRTWGNRNASFPTNTTPNNFIAVQRTVDVIAESVENAMLQFMDKPINQALIDAIRETCNQFIRVLIGRGALIPGSRVDFPKDVNTSIEIAAGHLTYDIIMLPPPPFERGTFRHFIDISLLKNLS